MLDLTPVPALSDNYIWLLHGRDPSRVAIVDPGEAEPVREAISRNGLTPEAILVTHRHWDHVNGIKALVADFDIPVYGPAKEAIPVLDHGLDEGDHLTLPALGLSFSVTAIPGHTLGHIAYHGHGCLLSGDTLFSGGCGRMFEGDPRQMLDSLERLAALPEETRLYCGHEYTLKNLAFCRAVEPDNPVIDEVEQRARERLDAGRPSLPSTLGEEKQFNVFLRCREDSVRQAAEHRAGQSLPDPESVFAVIRDWKDQF